VNPRALQPTEWDQLNHVVSTVFRPSMFSDYPQLFNPENIDNLRVVAEDGKLVCHVGMTHRPATLFGCRIDVASIGAVATLDDYRGKGHASAAFQDACDTSARAGIDIMLISGGRGLYLRAGCRVVGLDHDFYLDDAATDRLASVRPPGGGAFALVPLEATHIAEMRDLQTAESVRYIRRAEDWRMALDCGVVMNTASDFWGVRVGDLLVAYTIVHQPAKARRREGDPTFARVVEFAGVRASVIAALPMLRRHYAVEQVRIHAQGSDPVLARVLRLTTGVEGIESGFSGTLRVINFSQLMERCRPLLAERIGHGATEGLVFEADAPAGSADGGFTFRRGSQTVRVKDLGSLATFLFGARKPAESDSAPTGDEALLNDLRAAFPLPVPWYGISYV
jgi:predicted N-acetyltransferase YhbS